MTPDNPLEDITVEVVCTANAARIVGFSERQVRRWCEDGTLEGAERRAGFHTKWLIPRAALAKIPRKLED